jgi:hypothetical protein
MDGMQQLTSFGRFHSRAGVAPAVQTAGRSIGGLAIYFLRFIVLVICLTAPLWAADEPDVVQFAEDRVGIAPTDFDFGVTGHGDAGRWSIVRDVTAASGVALEQSSNDPTEDRFDFAVYRSLCLKNFAVSARVKLISGTMKSAGLTFRFLDSKNYYVLVENALEGRVDIFIVKDGNMKRVSGRDADVVTDHWQKLKLIADVDRFDVWLDESFLLTVWDRAILTEGGIGLWTREDNVTRFDQFEITPLAWSETP